MSTLINRNPTRLAPSLHLVKPTGYLFLLVLNKLEVLPLRHEEANFATSKRKEGWLVCLPWAEKSSRRMDFRRGSI